MKVIAFLALLAFSASAFNLTAYHLGIDAQLGFNETEVQQGLVCLNALSANFSQIVATIQSASFDIIALNLGGQIEAVKTTFQTTCAPYFIDYAGYIYEETHDVNNTELEQTIKQNWELYYPQVIQQVANWTNLIATGQDYQAGEVQSLIGQILIGAVVPTTIEVPSATEYVPFNSSKFYLEYFETVFAVLGIQADVNVSAVVECEYSVKNVSLTYFYIKQNFSSMDFEQKLNAVQYLLSLGFESIRNCEAANSGVFGLILAPQYEAFKQDPVHFTLEVLYRVAIDLPEYIASIHQEFVDIQEGNYVAAGQEKANRINNDFAGLVNYTTITN